MDKTQDSNICCLQEIHFKDEDTHNLKTRGWRITFHVNVNDKKPGVENFQDSGGIRMIYHLPPQKCIKIHLHVKQQNNFWTLAEDPGLLKRQVNLHRMSGWISMGVLICWVLLSPFVLGFYLFIICLYVCLTFFLLFFLLSVSFFLSWAVWLVNSWS